MYDVNIFTNFIDTRRDGFDKIKTKQLIRTTNLYVVSGDSVAVTVLRTDGVSFSILDSTFSRLSKERNSFSKNVCYFERESNIDVQNAVAFESQYSSYQN